MDKVVLSEISLVHGEVKTPKGFEIDRKKIKNDIISSYVEKNRVSNNNKDFSYNDYKLNISQKIRWLLDYIRDHFNEKYKQPKKPMSVPTIVGKRNDAIAAPVVANSIRVNHSEKFHPFLYP